MDTASPAPAHERDRRRRHRVLRRALRPPLVPPGHGGAPARGQVATVNRTREVAVEAPRGRILDRNGKVIVDNRTSLVVTIDRYAFNKMKAADQADDWCRSWPPLFTDFGTPTKIEAIQTRLDDQQYDDLQPVPIATDITTDLMVVPRRARRRVPQRRRRARVGAAVQLPGRGRQHPRLRGPHHRGDARRTPTPGTDPDGVVKTYQPDSTIGLAGVEATYEKDLRGTPGTKTLEIDAKNRVVGVLESQDPQPGSDIQLNIDIDLQMKAEEAVQGQLAATGVGSSRDPDGKTYRKNAPGRVGRGRGPERRRRCWPWRPTRATTPRSSSTASAPSATPSSPTTTASARSSTARSPASTRPGSTFKLVTATAALDNGIVNPNTPYNDKGRTASSPTIRSASGRQGATASCSCRELSRSRRTSTSTGSATRWTERAAAPSSRTPPRTFGFTTPSGIDLPNEALGLRPDRGQAPQSSTTSIPMPTPAATGTPATTSRRPSVRAWCW